MISILFLLLGIGCYSIKELHAHSKLKWQKGDDSFWGEKSDLRKYKLVKSPLFRDGEWIEMPAKSPLNFYYRYIAKVPYRERWFTSTNLTVFLTDAPHALQFIMFVLFSLSVSLPLDIGWNEFWEWALVWSLSHLTHFFTYWILQKK